MNQPPKEKTISIPDYQTTLTERQLKILQGYFDCRSAEDLIYAAQRYCDLLWERNMEGADPMELALSLALELYDNFNDLDKPATYKYPAKKNGPNQKSDARYCIRDNFRGIEKRLAELKESEKMNQKKGIRHLQNAGQLPNDVSVSFIEDELQQLREKRREMEEMAKDWLQ